MATKRIQQRDHDKHLRMIDDLVVAESWEERLSVIDLVMELLRDLPAESTVEHLVRVLDRVAADPKWELRKAVIPALVDTSHPSARPVIERLLLDGNQWVRSAAMRAKRKLSRITTAADKRDKRARFAFETIKELDPTSPENIYNAALLVGEKCYEELAGDTAHELNTYRATLEGLLQELEGQLPSGNHGSSRVPEIIGKIRNRSRYLKSLVSGLLEYSRDNDQEFQVQPLDPIINEALVLARDKAKGLLAGKEVEEILTTQPEVELEISRNRLLLALVNILSNAFESFAGNGQSARIEISVRADGEGHVVLTIRDTGSGMDPSQVENATKPFRSLKKERGGVGLGLPLAIKVIEREHRGRFEIESGIGAGTTVKVDLPMKRESD